MYSVQAGMWDPRPPSKHASPIPPQPPSSVRLAHVTSATPAKRITFYKSGDSQFGGVRMAVHKRSFKCFDALLDDLSQKVPLPFGVRTVTTPRGTHTIKHLEQLQDGGCYLCSDRRQAKPINMELARKHPGIWYHESRKPHRPETSSTTPPGHLPYRQRRILLVKNSEPGVRRSVVLSRRSTRSLRAFLDEVSEVMQFHVRKLYTAEGRRIDSVQSLMTCPGVLVCVGREAFSPMLVNFIRKSSEEKLPGLGTRSPSLGPRTPGNGARSPATQGARSSPHGAQSRASEYSEGHESKKNVNFGLETKKSIIHPRSDSSNRSTRFSLSSEKSYGNGVSAYSQAKPSIMNEDIEKRVLVNKDGSLSVEMRVRFRLQNDETLQWSTQIKKSLSLTNDCCPLSQAQPHYLQQGQSESCSDPDSASFDPEGVDYSSQPLQHASQGSHCSCCYQRQEQQYDLWENPAHSRKQPPVPPPHTCSHTMMRHTHSSSSSSSCNSRRVLRCRARLSNCGGGSEQLVQEEMCVTEQVERRVEVEQDGDTHVEVCRVSRCCSRSEVVAVENNLRPLSQKSDDELMEETERSLSAVSSSSCVLQSLKEDQDDDPPHSASGCCHSNQPSPTSQTPLNDKRSNVSAGSVHSTEHEKHEDGEEGGAVSAASSCHCGAATGEAEELERAEVSRASCKISNSEEEGAADDEDEEVKRAVSGLSGHTAGSLQSKASSVCPNCGGCKRGSNSRASQGSSPKPPTPLTSQENDDDGSDNSAGSTQSNKTNLTSHGRCSAISNILEDRAPSVMSKTSDPEAAGKEEERAPSATSASSHKSNTSHKSGCKGNSSVTAAKEEQRSLSAMSAKTSKSQKSSCSCSAEAREEAEGENAAERAPSSLSAKSGVSSKTNASVNLSIKVASPTDNTPVEEDDTKRTSPSILSVKSNASAKSGKPERPDSVLSARSIESNVSAKSGTSHKSTCSQCARAVSPGDKAADEPGQGDGTEAEERAASAMSAKSNKSQKSKTSERSRSPRSETGEDGEKRAASQMSARSVKSNISAKSGEGSEKGDGGKDEDRAASALSGKSASSARSHQTVCSPAKSTAKTEVDRIPSVMSGKSHTSAKSQKSNRTTTSPNPKEADGPSLETNGEENQNQERVASAMSGKSKTSVRSAASHKSNSSKDLKLLSPNVVTIKTPEGVDEEGNETTERGPSAASCKSGKSNVKTRGPSSLSVHSTMSAKSSRSKCRCGATSALENAQKEKEGEDKWEQKSEGAVSLLSSSTKRQRKESGGTEQPLSRTSSGSVSLGLPEDQETADSDSGKSTVSFHLNAESKSRVKTATPGVPRSSEQSDMKENAEETGSVRSQKSNNNGSKSTLSHNPPAVDIPTIETPGGEDDGEQTTRAASAFSTKSSKSHKSSCNCSVKAAAQMLNSESEGQNVCASPTKAGNDLETGSVKTKASDIDAPDNRTSSPVSSASAKVRSKSSASATVKNASRPASKAKGKDDKADNSVHSKSPCCLRPDSAASKAKSSKESKGKDPVSSDSLDPVKGHKAKSSVKSSSSRKKETPIKSSSPCPLHSSRPCSKAEACSESALSHSLSAADLLKEMAAARPHSRQSKASNTSEKSGRCQRRKNQRDQEEELDLTPACLPNASPSEVVSDWLRSIPANSSMLALGDDLNEEEQEKVVEDKPGKEVAKEESPDDGKVENEEKAEEEEEKEEEKTSDPAPASSRADAVLLSSESTPRSWHSSAAVMKVLLSSSLGRCQSMPEVSPVYGRRLSASARGLLDCLSQLQLIEPAMSPGCDQQKLRNQQYEDIMAILQSLWLTEPRNIEAKNVGTEQVTPPRSSSGVGMSSGSGGSGKENGNQGGDETKEDEGVEKAVEGVKQTEAETEQNKAEEEPVQSEDQSTVPPSHDSPKATENPSSSDKSSANDSSKSPTDNERETAEDSSSGTPPTVLRAPLSKRLSQDPDPVWILHLLKKLEKQFMNHYINAMAEFKVRWDLDDSLILDTMISELRDEVSRRIQSSIEREMRKIQSRAGKGGRLPRPPQGGNLSRESTMTEKRRRMLKVMKNQSVKTADSLSDGELTGDFSDQRSDDEYCPCDACVRKKMAARPLKTNPMAAEAPVMMEFDLLKILQLKKTPAPAPAPAAVPQPTEREDDSVVVEEEGRNLEVVQEEEEDEETKEDIKADVVLEETIPEEDEEVEEGGEAEEREEVEAKKEEEEGSSAGDEEQEEEETGNEEAGEEETSENGEEEEEEVECQCQCAGNEGEGDEAEEGEETSDNTGEDETADDEERSGEEEGENAEDEGETGSGEEEEEEESDKVTVKETTEGEGETTENGEEEEEEEEEECEASDSKTEKEEGEASGETEDDTAAKEAANEESALVEGNLSASAEAEDEDEGDTGEGESHEDEKGGQSEEQEGEASEEERTSTQEQGPTEGEEADAEDSDTDNKRPSDTSADESGREGAGTTGDEEEEEKEAGGDAVEEFKPDEEEEEEEDRNKKEEGALLHQFTRTSVESQPGSLEDVDSPQNPVHSIEVPKMAAGVSSGGGTGLRRSRSPARVKRRKPKESDAEVDDY